MSTHWLVFVDQWDPKSPWADRRVRLAANHAMDRQAVNEALTLGFSRITWSIIPQSFDFFWQPPAYAYDPAKAKQLLAEAGYPKGFDAGDLWCDAATATMSEALVGYLQAAGIRARVRPLERAAFFKGYQEKKLKNLVYSLSGAFGNAATRLETFVASGGPYVYGSYPDIDGLFSEQAGELDRKRREAIAPPDPAARARQGHVRPHLGARLHPRPRPAGGGVGPRAHHRLGVLRALRGREAEGQVREVSMDKHSPGRRTFLKKMIALGAAGVPIAAALRPGPVHSADATGGSRMKTAYDPAATFELKVSEVEFRRTPGGRMLMARIYQPQGAGPFPTLLDLHGGAWNRKDRFAEEPMDRAVAASGVLVVAIDMTLAPEAPYPACVQDANYGVRWLKSKAAGWNGDPSKVGVYGSSSGGHVAELLGMRPRDARYNAIPLPAAPHIDATVAYVATRSPISDPYARFQQAEKMKRAGMIQNNKIFFNPWETIHEGNPQQILERREAVTLPPLLIMQGALDDNVLPAVQEKFAATYKAAGGECQLHVFEGSEHEWVAKPGPQTDRAREMVKAFIARNVAA